MLPFSKRPPPPDEYLLRSGDLEAVRQDPYARSHAGPASYAPPPAFVRQAAQTPYGYTQSQQQQYPRNDLSAPPPPHSLAPMAMSADSSGHHYMSTTGVSRMSHTSAGRERPSVKWGVLIALSGALLGGVLGLGMDARRQSARAAAAAADAADAATPVAAAAALQAPAAPLAVAPRAVTPPAPVAPAPLPVAAAVAAPPVGPVGVAPAPAIIAPPPPAPAPVVLAAAPPVVVKSAPVVHARSFGKPHGFLAAKVTPPSRPAPEPKAEAPEPKASKAEAKAPPAKKDASTSDAMKILEAANKDTTNTL